ncbi:pre-mRNA-splicing regulator WTAP-like [Hydractinia symbiolongicarpus]|uniref:pre-mRNA-splicing regulator WTAP-like n=1 Tax=Hydractinia symbiolongicarpus TaxID=13093 RepID=UPI00254AB013|nr:pre-mRNA-splicing regulator WTAP-like [Hydractinia symbiolongicarpus]
MEKPSSPVPLTAIPVRVAISDDEKETLTKEDVLTKFKDLESYLNHVEDQGDSKSLDEKLKLQQQEATRRENVLVMRLATKEQEMQELVTQIQELKQAQTPSTTQLQTMLLDPAVNLLFEKMITELTETKDRLDQAQSDLNAWKFTPDSVTGKKLMAKCRKLILENQELGKQLSQGRIAQLEAELALQKKYSEELKGSQDEMNEFVIQLDEEVEGMQATICTLQQQLKDTNQNVTRLEEENQRLLERLNERSSKTTNSNGEETLKQETLYNHSSSEHQIGDLQCNDFHEAKNHSETHQHLSTVKVKEELMDVDEKISDLQNKEPVERTIELQDANQTRNQVLVIRGTEDNKRDVDSKVNQYVSPTKTAPKTSFSITDLLSNPKDSVKTETGMSAEVSKHEKNGENGTLNGEIDDAAI